MRKRRLIISLIVMFPLLLFSSRFFLKETWGVSLFMASFQVIFFGIGFLFFINWWNRKSKEQSKT